MNSIIKDTSFRKNIKPGKIKLLMVIRTNENIDHKFKQSLFMGFLFHLIYI